MKTITPTLPEEPVVTKNESKTAVSPRLIFSSDVEQVFAFENDIYVRLLISESQSVVESTCTCGKKRCEHRKAALASFSSESEPVDSMQEEEFDEDGIGDLLERMQDLETGQLLTVLFDTLAMHPEVAEYLLEVLPVQEEDDEEEPLFS